LTSTIYRIVTKIKNCLIQDEKFGLAGLKDFSKGRENMPSATLHFILGK